MTQKAIKEYFNNHLNIGDEKIVDIDKFTVLGEEYVNLFTITKRHTVWKHLFLIKENILIRVEMKLLG